jgi:hypothetical protein
VGVEEHSQRFAVAGFPSSEGVLLPFLFGGPEDEDELKGEEEREGVKGAGVFACFQAANAIIQQFSHVAKPPRVCSRCCKPPINWRTPASTNLE